MDLITDLPPSRSFDSVMVVVDHGLMKGIILCPCNKNIDMRKLEESRKEALAAYKKAWKTMKKWISSKFCPWKSGDKVWLEGKNLKLHYPSKKLALKKEGPFEITQVISLVAYKLQLPPTWKIHDIFHASLLLSYKETLEHGPNFSNPPPDLIEGEEEYKIDKILSHCGT